MVYCTKCGTVNDEDALECKNCGVVMKSPAYRYRRHDWDFEDGLFGGRGRSSWSMIFGIFLILWGASTLLDELFWWASFDFLWPLFIMAVGVLIVSNAMKR